MNHVIDCDILTADEAFRLHDNILTMNTSWSFSLDDWVMWWRSDYLFESEETMTDGKAIRPCLRMDECTFKVGDAVDWFGLRWRYIGENIWLCDYAIDYMVKYKSYTELHTWLNAWYAGKLSENKGV